MKLAGKRTIVRFFFSLWFYFRVACFFCAFFLFDLAQAAPLRLVFSADTPLEVQKDLEAFLSRYLSREDAAGASPEERERARQSRAFELEKTGSELLATEGYFDARLEARARNESEDAFTLWVHPGRLTRVVSVDLALEGVLPEERRSALLAAWRLGKDAVFRQEDWNAAKEALLQDLLEKDFPDARIVFSEARVENGAARLVVRFESGAAYRFGALEIEGLARYSPDLVRRYNKRAREGSPYSAEALSALRGALENSPYFSLVSVRLDRESAREDERGFRIAPVRVTLSERAAHQLGFGVGVSSNTGARAEINWRTADLFSRAIEMKGGLRLETLRQSLYADFFLPPGEGAYRYALGFLLDKSDIRNLKLTSGALGISRSRQSGHIRHSQNLSFITEREESPDRSIRRNRALSLNFSWTWTPEVSFGEHLSQFQLGSALKPVSDQNFVRVYALARQRFYLSPRDSLMLRAESGIVLADSREGIPQNFLFRAGGSASVRGYAYQSLGVKEGRGTLGGRYLMTFSGEYTRWFADSPWGAAIFMDMGNAGDDKKLFRLARGYGAGARWRNQSTVLGLDAAYGEAARSWRLHFAFEVPF